VDKTTLHCLALVSLKFLEIHSFRHRKGAYIQINRVKDVELRVDITIVILAHVLSISLTRNRVTKRLSD
jgi:hypothetical protein